VNQSVRSNPANGLAALGISGAAAVHWNLTEAQLYQAAIERHEGLVAVNGPLAVTTGQHTGRSAKDKFFVRDAETENTIWWDNNRAITPENFATSSATCSPMRRTASCSCRTSMAAPTRPIASASG
jgi:phosphoenolpyruvate carboxykinase (ATP)